MKDLGSFSVMLILQVTVLKYVQYMKKHYCVSLLWISYSGYIGLYSLLLSLVLLLRMLKIVLYSIYYLLSTVLNKLYWCTVLVYVYMYVPLILQQKVWTKKIHLYIQYFWCKEN